MVEGFFVQWGIFFDIVCDICNVYIDFYFFVFQVVDGQGIVKVFGIFGVNGDGGNFLQVMVVFNFFFVDLCRQVFGFLFDILWEFQVKVVVD